MEFGLHMPTDGPLATPDTLISLAQRVEALGFSIITAGDHIVTPKDVESAYPYTRAGRARARPEGDWLENLTLLAFLAAHTSKVRLLPSVTILPYRNPVIAAKIFATIDVLSRGRVIAACGLGWLREEFEALGVPPFEERGIVADEYLRAFKELWTSDSPTFEGKYCRFSNIYFEPKPVQKPHPPIWIAGESTPALRRVGQLGDGWQPVVNNPKHPLDTADQVATSLARIHGYAEEAGRDPSKITVAYEAEWNDEARVVFSGERRAFTGTPEQMTEDIRAFEKVGVQYVLWTLPGANMDETSERIEHIAGVVKPGTSN